MRVHDQCQRSSPKSRQFQCEAYDIEKLLIQGMRELSKISKTPRLDAEVLLAHLLKRNRSWLHAHALDLLLPGQISSFLTLLEERKAGKPVALITGIREFWSLPFFVNQHTLIPRPATETLIEVTLQSLPRNIPLKILDLGTGSGIIALTLAKERPTWVVSACDKNLEALQVAQQNAAALGLNQVTFYHSNWFDQLPSCGYDAILSNPPYIAENDPHLFDLRFEPQEALVSKAQGMFDLMHIIQNSKPFLNPGGVLILEHGSLQKMEVQSIMNANGFSDINTWQDLEGHDRVTKGNRFS